MFEDLLVLGEKNIIILCVSKFLTGSVQGKLVC